MTEYFTNNNDTIVAIATASGRGSVGIVRVSGLKTLEIAQKLIKTNLKPRFATFTPFYDEFDDILDEGIAIYFQNPNSFTGEDVLELQGHGGNIVLNQVLKACIQAGARLAEPGEFTQRAFLNNKIDLIQAESIADLIDATSQRAVKSALRSLQGKFSHQINDLLQDLIRLRLYVEATLDFPEEEIDFLQASKADKKLYHLIDQIQTIKKTAQQGKILSEGLQVVLIGQPNVGKSSLLNQLAGDDIAIVTPIAGTTRDAVRESIQIEGIPIHIIDTAGLRETTDIVEKIGIERTWKAIENADLALLLIDVTRGEDDENQQILDKLPQNLPVLKIYNKIDLSEYNIDLNHSHTLAISAKQGLGVDILKQKILSIAGFQMGNEDIFIARQRHLDALSKTLDHLYLAQEQLQFEQIELFAEECRLAQNELNKITGEFTPDDLLGEIFSKFCIGK